MVVAVARPQLSLRPFGCCRVSRTRAASQAVARSAERVELAAAVLAERSSTIIAALAAAVAPLSQSVASRQLSPAVVAAAVPRTKLALRFPATVAPRVLQLARARPESVQTVPMVSTTRRATPSAVVEADKQLLVAPVVRTRRQVLLKMDKPVVAPQRVPVVTVAPMPTGTQPVAAELVTPEVAAAPRRLASRSLVRAVAVARAGWSELRLSLRAVPRQRSQEATPHKLLKA